MEFRLLHPQDQIVMIMQRIYDNDMTTTSGGNISIKDENGNIWISPSGIDKGSLTRDDICMVKPDGTIVSKHKPSVELPFHRLIYKTRPDASAVIHAHPSALVSFSCARKIPNTRIIPTPHYVCGEVAVAKYAVPGSEKLGVEIAKKFQEGYNTVMMENHGVVVCGEDLFEAFKRFETLDFCARLNLKSEELGKINVLSDAQMALESKKTAASMNEFIPKTFSCEERTARRVMCELIHRAYNHRLFTSTQGTFSQRLSSDSFVITPHAIDRKYLEPEDLVRIEGGYKEAGKTPSESVLLHKLIYAQHPEVQSIIIAHPTNVMAFGITRTTLNTRTIPESYIMLRDLAVVPYGTAVTNPKAISDMISESCPVVLAENDFFIATGSSLLNCFDKLEVAEFTAKTLITAKKLGNLVPINDEETEEIKEVFKLK